jgi:hypothetical protein
MLCKELLIAGKLAEATLASSPSLGDTIWVWVRVGHFVSFTQTIQLRASVDERNLTE